MDFGSSARPFAYVQGFNSDFNEALKSETLRVTSVSSCTWAVAAMSASIALKGRPKPYNCLENKLTCVLHIDVKILNFNRKVSTA